ncbi:MAG: hypothetical protein WDM85_07480 [Caulobacteraceae bacterium]
MANCFGELTDADEQRRRFEADMADSNAFTAERYPIDEDFLAALATCRRPAARRWGFDRLAMLGHRCGADRRGAVDAGCRAAAGGRIGRRWR